jgi:hypothetical protein
MRKVYGPGVALARKTLNVRLISHNVLTELDRSEHRAHSFDGGVQ